MALKVVDQASVKDALKTVLAPGQTRGWALFGYVPGSKTDLVVQKVEVGGNCDGLVAALNDSEMQYAVIRIPDKKDKNDTVRDIMIAWTGPSMGIMERSKKKVHIGEVKELLAPFHADLEAIGKTNFTEAIVMDRAGPLSGSHVID